MSWKRGVQLAVFSALSISLLISPPTSASVPEEEDFGELSLEELLDVPVTAASRDVKSVREAPAAVYVVTHTMIHERGYNYLFDALRDAPGFDIIWMGGLYGPVLMQHGLDTPENNKLLLMIDGIVDNNLSAGTAQVYMQYSLHNVERIEILYGPASALYGANAMTGLINIITKKGVDLNGVEAQGGAVVWDSGFRRTGAAGAAAAGKVWGEEGEKVDVSGSFHIINTDGTDLRLSDLARSDDPSFPAASSYYFSPDYIGSSERSTFLAQARAAFESIGLTVGGHVWQHRGGQGTYGHEAFFLNAFQNKPDTWNYRNSTIFVEHNADLHPVVSNRARFVFRDTRILGDSYDATFNVPGSGPDGEGSPGLAGSRYAAPTTPSCWKTAFTGCSPAIPRLRRARRWSCSASAIISYPPGTRSTTSFWRTPEQSRISMSRVCMITMTTARSWSTRGESHRNSR